MSNLSIFIVSLKITYTLYFFTFSIYFNNKILCYSIFQQHLTHNTLITVLNLRSIMTGQLVNLIRKTNEIIDE